MTDNLRDRIADVLVQALRSQADLGGFLNEYDPCDDDGNPCGGTLLRIDAVVDQHILADAVIEALELGIPCASDGCRMRQIARRSAEKLGLTGDGE